MGAEYLNTDLEIAARFNFSSLILALNSSNLDQLGEAILQDGHWRVTLESDLIDQTPETDIDRLLQVIERLENEDRRLWDQCETRRINVGFKCRSGEFHSNWHFHPTLLARLVAANAELVVTIYRSDKERN